MHSRLVTVVILITNFYAFRIFVSGNNEDVLYKENYKRCQAFRCGPPQPRIKAYQEILKDNYTRKPCEDVSPKVTVVHICDFAAGYCSFTSSCEPEETEEVNVVFRVTHLDISAGCILQENVTKTRYVMATFINHTLCSCQKDTNLIK